MASLGHLTEAAPRMNCSTSARFHRPSFMFGLSSMCPLLDHRLSNSTSTVLRCCHLFVLDPFLPFQGPSRREIRAPFDRNDVPFRLDRMERRISGWASKPPLRPTMPRSEAHSRDAPRMTCASHANMDVRSVARSPAPTIATNCNSTEATAAPCDALHCLTAGGWLSGRCRRRLRSTLRCKQMHSR